MIDFDSEFDLAEVSVGDDYFPEYAGLDHSDESLHLFEVGVQRVRDDVVDLIGRLVLQHEEVGVNADEVLAQRTALGLAHDLGPVFLAD